jgi:nitrite reductase/ring-hydroxylating ferredoxin subunit
MTRHIVAKAAELPPGSRKLVHLGTRDIVLLNIKGELFALSDKCPHKGGSLSLGKLTGVVSSTEPGTYDYSRPGEILRCPWHGWEFDVRTGQSWCDPQRMRLVNYAVSVEPGAKLVEGPYVAETFAVSVEDDYVVVETK